MAQVTDGRGWVALRRISDSKDATLADVGETCERVPVDGLSCRHECEAIERAAPAAEVRRRRRREGDD